MQTPARRELLTGLAGALSAFGSAHGFEAPAAARPATKAGYSVDREDAGGTELSVHGGDGLIRMKAFDFQGASRPSLMLLYVIPPGAGEGVHVHRRGDRALGSYDEFYYVLAGSGVMRLGGEDRPVAAGDHVFTPLGLPHGVRNTSAAELRIFLTAIERT